MLFQQSLGLRYGSVHNNAARRDRESIGRKKIDLLPRAFDQLIADLIESANRLVIAPRRINHSQLRIERNNPHVRMHPARHLLVIRIERAWAVRQMNFLVAGPLEYRNDLLGAIAIAV